jgi:hypothetical protein
MLTFVMYLFNIKLTNLNSKNMETINFTKCTLAFMEKRLHLRPALHSVVLTNWVKTTNILNDFEIQSVKHLSAHLAMNAFHWNEQALSMHFIGPMFTLPNFTEMSRFNIFPQESISAEVEPNLTLNGRVDEMIATGFRAPETPFFAFNEYKRETDPEGDPNGQCLAAMLVGQKINENELPIYGCVVIGRVWRFAVLENKTYSFSRNFDGAEFDDACQILRILKELKVYCMERTA